MTFEKCICLNSAGLIWTHFDSLCKIRKYLESPQDSAGLVWDFLYFIKLLLIMMFEKCICLKLSWTRLDSLGKIRN